jgi:hypothetical protein
MGSYGQAALDAVKLVKERRANDPVDGWEKATISLFSKGTSSQVKSCPRHAFLGVCEDGLVKGIKPGKYTDSVDNKSYAVEAVKLLKTNPSLSSGTKADLWRRVMRRTGNPIDKTHNQQMDVILALFQNRFIA